MLLKHFRSSCPDENNRYQLAAFLAYALMLCISVHDLDFLLSVAPLLPKSFCA